MKKTRTAAVGAVRRFLRWARIEDRSGRLSLTTVAFAFALVSVWLGRAISLTELAAFVTAVGAHRHRERVDADAAADGRVFPC